jgi:hypothetical protein
VKPGPKFLSWALESQKKIKKNVVVVAVVVAVVVGVVGKL